MTRFRKRFPAEQIVEIRSRHSSSLKQVEERKIVDSHKLNSPSGFGNLGSLIVNTTCVPSYIKYTCNIELINKEREKLEKNIDYLHAPKTDEK